MDIRDSSATVGFLKKEVIAMCLRKGWGDERGIQHPQHIAAAMMVEMMELLEHFMGIEGDVDAHFTPDEVIETSEEAADVMMYSMQIMYTMGYDVSKGLCEDFSDDTTPISEMRRYVGACSTDAVQQALRLATQARFLLEELQWMTEEEVQLMIKGGLSERRQAIGKAFIPLFREMLILANKLNFEISGVIMRKIAIVDKRVYSDSEPVR